MVLPTNAKAGDPLSHDLINAIGSDVNTNVTSAGSVTTAITTTKATLASAQTLTSANQSALVTANQKSSTQVSAASTIQTQITAALARLAVLENATAPPATPGAPTALTPGAITTTSFAFSWTPPVGGSAPTSYQTRVAPAGTTTWTLGPSVAAAVHTATITGLTQGAAYDFDVIAINAAGPGGTSLPMRGTTLAVFIPSPGGTTVPPASTIVMHDGALVTLLSGVVMRDTGTGPAPMGTTSQVILLYVNASGVVYQENSALGWWYWDPTQTNPWVFTSDPRVAPPVSGSGGPGAGPPFQNLTSFLDMHNGQKCSTGVTLLTTDVPGFNGYEIQIKPYEVNGVGRPGELGTYIGPVTACFVAQGGYLWTPDVAPIYSALGCPNVDPAVNPVSGIRPHIRWWTVGSTVTTPVTWGLYYEPGMDSGPGEVYAVITDYKGTRGDTFHVTANMAGRGIVRQTAWGSILDFSAEASGIPGFGLGWVAFPGYAFAMNQIIADW
jgi:hypothetical protein